MCVNSNRTIDYDPFHDKEVIYATKNRSPIAIFDGVGTILRDLAAFAINMTILHS